MSCCQCSDYIRNETSLKKTHSTQGKEYIMNIKPDFLRWINISSTFFLILSNCQPKTCTMRQKKPYNTTDYFTAFLIHCQWTSIPTSQLSSPHALMQHSHQIWRILSALYQTLEVFSQNLFPALDPWIQSFLRSNYFSGCPSNSVFFYHHSGSNVDHPQSSRLLCCRSIKFPGIISYSLY